MSDIKIRGLAELNKLLQELPGKIEANVVGGALRAGANVFRDAVREAIPVDSGLTKKDARVTVRKDRKTGRIAAKLSFRRRAHIARFVEYGTKPHIIDARKNGNETRKLRFGNTFYTAVMHPGIKPKPFLRPAFDGNTRQATVAFGNYVKKRLQTKHGIDTADIQITSEE